MHGYQILGAVLKEWRADNNIVTTVVDSKFALTLGITYPLEASSSNEK
jgi:hypothetical protein